MRLYEFITNLFEYSRDITKQRLGDRLIVAAQRDRKQDIDTILSTLENIDPTKNKQYVQWLANQYIKNQFRLEDASRVKEVLVNFEKLKPRLPQKDINRYTFHELDDIIDKAYNVELKSDDDENIADVKVLYKGPLGQLTIPLTMEASCRLGSGTKWCTAARNDNRFDEYNADGPLYIWKDKTGKKYQFHFPSVQFMDDKDHEISNELFKYFREDHPIISKLFKKEEKEIAKDANNSYDYAYEVLHQRFPEGEPAIAQNYTFSELYQKNILKNSRFPELEKLLLARGNIPDMINYIQNTDDMPRIPEFEQAILDSEEPVYALNYARKIIDDRWPEAEALIASHPDTANSYAHAIIGGKWRPGEAAIATDPYTSLDYAKLTGEPFPAGEAVMKKHPNIWSHYIQM